MTPTKPQEDNRIALKGWGCVACGSRGLGNMDELRAHLSTCEKYQATFMTTESTPEERAAIYAANTFEATQNKTRPEWPGIGPTIRAFHAGRRDFIKHDLRKWLEMARERTWSDIRGDTVVKFSIEEIISIAKAKEKV